MPLPKKLAILYLKYLAVGYLFVRKWLISLSRMLTSLPPWSIIRLSLLASSYAPGSSGTLRTLGRVNLDHLFLIGIISSLKSGICIMCYNILKSYISPRMVIMTAGGLEPPRQRTARSFQNYDVCQLHHADTKSGEGDLAKDYPSPKPPQLKRYHKWCSLSIDKTIVDVFNLLFLMFEEFLMSRGHMN